MPVVDVHGLVAERVEALRQFHATTGLARAELDVSGGVDSAVLLALLSKALGPAQITACFLDIDSSGWARARALEAAAAAGVALVVDTLGDEFRARVAHMLDNLVQAGFDRATIEARLARDPSVLGSLRSCLRAPLGRGYNRLTGGGVRHGTGNEDEDRFVRFYQKGGDGEVDTNPIAMLAKGEVYQLGLALGIPQSVLAADPSPDLWGAGVHHTDEQELQTATGVAWSYSRIDLATGQYRCVGTIERMNRYLDACADALFDPQVALADLLDGRGFPAAMGHPAFAGLERATVEALLASARRLEATSRHKANPNIPALGSRRALLDAGLLCNDLPKL